MPEYSPTVHKYFEAGDLAHCPVVFRTTYSGGTAPDSHRIPHLFPARAASFPEVPPVFTEAGHA
ncbi:hypothetical protein HMPREF3039_02290 [Akkermansia sp. KLE1798]|nr:hypothetical protein HMPREF3039_02290 [Akkermansia sp. KLE1798]KZA05764.1 hypothetical protein HMPREF1326_00590 [Akkermansia sp. KLE1605]